MWDVPGVYSISFRFSLLDKNVRNSSDRAFFRFRPFFKKVANFLLLTPRGSVPIVKTIVTHMFAMSLLVSQKFDASRLKRLSGTGKIRLLRPACKFCSLIRTIWFFLSVHMIIIMPTGKVEISLRIAQADFNLTCVHVK